MFKIGDSVICIREPAVPQFVGTVWTVIGFDTNMVLCENRRNFREIGGFPFRYNEIVPWSSLIKELM
jgi:hypothetical protein